jgi:hypothetical protein
MLRAEEVEQKVGWTDCLADPADAIKGFARLTPALIPHELNN